MQLRLLFFFLLALLPLVAQAQETEETSSELREFSLLLLEANDLTTAYEEVVREFTTQNKRIKPPCRLERVSRILEDPFCLETVSLTLGRSLEEQVKNSGLEDLAELFARGLDAIDVTFAEREEPPALAESEAPERHLARIEATLRRAAQLRAYALAELSLESIELAHTGLPMIVDQFIHHVYLEIDAEPEALKTMRSALRHLKAVDLQRMAQAAAILSALASKASVKQLKKDLRGFREEVPPEAAAAGFTGDILAYRQTDHGPIVIGGKRPTHYGGRAAFILDLGGNDTYTYAAATLGVKQGISMVLDLGGDDQYLTRERESLACARLGVALLFDLKGDDRYEGTRMAQGFAGGGISLLWDEEGEDHYQAEEFSQGAALFGLGLLVDREGDDRYETYLYSQGFGLTRGLGTLIDLDGEETYIATGKYPSTYGVEGIFHSGSQGHGTGLRRMQNARAPVYGGGIGLILDARGDDLYQAGNFSQGCGYFFGCGIFLDRQGNDRIEGTRYSQGTGAHYAAGILINCKGDDLYIAKVTANQAGPWDTTVAMLLDYEGNDSYQADSLAQGGAAQTGFALLFDGGGKDTYQATHRDCQGGTGSFEYHDQASFAFLLDLGGGKDQYNRPLRRDNKILLEKWYGVFYDGKSKTLSQALRSSPKKLKAEWGPREK